MAITDPTIDPITGLPLLNPQDVIQQIPLGNQVFPYDDLSATARPTRGPLYGDDILPTSAFVAAQHPTTGNAQTVETDAAHAMKVFVVNESGGGGPAPIAIKTDGFSYGTVSIGSSVANTLPGAAIAIYAVQCTWDVGNVDTPGQSGNILFGIQGSAAGNLIWLYQGSLSLLDTGGTNGVRESIYLPLNPPISIPLMGWLDSGGDVQTYILNNTLETLNAAMLAYYA